MAWNLATLPAGRRSKWVVLLAWVALLVPLAPLAAALPGLQRNDISAWLPAGSESARYVAESARFQPGDTMPAVVVYERAAGLNPADLQKSLRDIEAFRTVPGVHGTIPDPLVSTDNKAIRTLVPVRVGASGWAGIAEVVDRLNAVANADARGLQHSITGPAGYSADSGRLFGTASALMIITVIAVVVILLFTYRSAILWLVPVLAAGAALFTAEGVIFLLARFAGVVVNAQSSFILGVLVFGAATDYALLLTSRYREELRRHDDRHEAMAAALRRSGSAIVASALTVALSLLLLLLASLNSTRGLGPVCAAGVLAALAAMVTLLPALLVVLGRWVFWPAVPGREAAPAAARSGRGWDRLGAAVARRPRTVWALTVAVLAVLSTGLLGLDAHGVPQRQQYLVTTQAALGEAVYARHFPVGSGNPLFVVTSTASADQARLALSLTPGIDTVALVDRRGGQAFLLATPKAAAGTAESLRAADLARAAVHGVPGARAVLGGGSAFTLDLQMGAARDSRVVIPLILLMVLLVLILLLRSLVAPLVLLATVVLSFGAALGLSVVVFRQVFHFAGMDAAFPLQAFTFLVALGVDYNIFLVTRMREEATRHGARHGALAALSSTGGVITSAGLVLAATFATLGSLPMTFSAELGFAVAVGVLLDTFVVRAVLVTALSLDLGERFWWPARLAPAHPVPTPRPRPVDDSATPAPVAGPPALSRS